MQQKHLFDAIVLRNRQAMIEFHLYRQINYLCCIIIITAFYFLKAERNSMGTDFVYVVTFF